jgi:hypothetical protein
MFSLAGSVIFLFLFFYKRIGELRASLYFLLLGPEASTPPHDATVPPPMWLRLFSFSPPPFLRLPAPSSPSARPFYICRKRLGGALRLASFDGGEATQEEEEAAVAAAGVTVAGVGVGAAVPAGE